MKRTLKFPLLLLGASLLLLALTRQKTTAAAHLPRTITDTTCLVKSEASYDFADSLRKKVNAIIEDKIAGGIEENGKTTWENSPDAPEYYQIVLRRNKLSVKYKGTACQDRLIWENVEDCKKELKKLLGK
ncbi:MAG TPA: hypothetical protein VM802_17965 [Chitinophaga sp.]|uniref:hypothetical protein n=1 Tax=Chitinophaga sp. TaxID=1869181 RepID=UPI002BCEB9E5|nr:hypothetical protein [Chitinophaga sp.]HVI46770.1 hypothetical protein [Chitinophaga sp.]